MGYILFPALVLSIFVGIFAVQKTQVDKPIPRSELIQSTSDGQQFVNYRNAVAVYLQSNPTFIGSVPSSTLVAQGNRFSAQFLGSANNYVSQVGATSGRIITVYATLSPGAITAALKKTDNDSSLGIATSNKWVSYAQNAVTTPQPLAIAVPDGSVVSVTQIGG